MCIALTLVLTVLSGLSGCSSGGSAQLDGSPVESGSDSGAQSCQARSLLVAEDEMLVPANRPADLARIDLQSFAVSPPLVRIGPPVFMKRFGDTLYVVFIGRNQTLQAFSLPSLSRVGSAIVFGQTSVIADLVPGEGGRVYVADHGSNGIIIADPVSGARVGEIDLTPWQADRVEGLKRQGSKLYAASGGKVIIWDLAQNRFDGSIALVSDSARGGFIEEPGTTHVLLNNSHFGEPVGGIERLDLEGRRSLGMVVTVQALGGRHLSGFLMTPSGIGFALVGQDQGLYSTRLVPFTLSGEVESPVDLDQFAYIGGGGVVDDCNRLWITDARGVWAIDARTKQKIRDVIPFATRVSSPIVEP